MVTRHGRADEEPGRLELVGWAAVDRQTPLAGARVMRVGATRGLAVLTPVALTLLGVPIAGSLALALAIAGSGLVFTAVAAACAQIAGTARGARGLAIGVVGVPYLLRAIGDSAGPHGPRWLSWLSPIGWAELIRSFGAIRWWVLALPVLVAVGAAVPAGVLAVRRDYDAGMLPQRPGPARGSAWLRSTLGLAWRLHRGTLAGWLTGALIFGVIVGSAAKGIGGLLPSSQIRHIVTTPRGSFAITNAHLGALLGFTGRIAAGDTVFALVPLRSPGSSGHADPV